jgi:hypothetical protein
LRSSRTIQPKLDELIIQVKDGDDTPWSDIITPESLPERRKPAIKAVLAANYDLRRPGVRWIGTMSNTEARQTLLDGGRDNPSPMSISTSAASRLTGRSKTSTGFGDHALRRSPI